jgi:hypothetical protein
MDERDPYEKEMRQAPPVVGFLDERARAGKDMPDFKAFHRPTPARRAAKEVSPTQTQAASWPAHGVTSPPPRQRLTTPEASSRA